MSDPKLLMNASECLNYIHEKIFPLRPVDYGVKYPQWPGLVGIEIEMLPLRSGARASAVPAMVPLYGEGSVASTLYSLQGAHPEWNYQSVPEEPDHLFNIWLEDEDQISFEPGGQLEFSTRPYPCLSDAIRRVREVQGWVDAAAAAADIRIIQIGMNPWATVETIGLQMSKPRYRAMDAFFSQQGPDGRRMMRQTCTIQVNLDFGGTEEVLAKRFLAGNLVAPFATALFANSPLVDGKLSGLLSTRAQTWQNMDPTRTGFPKLDGVVKHLSRRACVEAYYDLVMKGRVVFIEQLDHRVPAQALSFQHWLEHGVDGVKPTLKDFQTHLSLMFPEARARGFIELRSVDCQHRFWQDVPGAFYTGLLYDEQTLNRLLDLLLPLRPQLLTHWKQSVHGLQEAGLRKVAQQVMELAREGFSRLPSCFRGAESTRLLHTFIDSMTACGLTPADAMLEEMRRDPAGRLSVASIDRLAEKWALAVAT